MALLLVADDDPHILDVVTYALERAGHRVLQARDGDEALMRARNARPDLLVLDIGMPRRDGLDVCRTLRADEGLGRLPIIVLSARDEEIDRVLGLEMGADDYVGKPFSPRELVARVAAVLRRREEGPDPASARLTHGDLTYDAGRAEARIGAEPVDLTAQEQAILAALLARPGHVLPRERIVALAYGDRPHVSDRTIDSHIRNLRAKFAAAGSGDVIETVHGLGFRMGPCKAVPPADTASAQ
ncbi:MAG: response regulator transcription factor [Pseudomonadota bacterium]